MKKVFYILAIVSQVFCGCKDFLTPESTYEVEKSDFWKTVDDAQMALNGVYASARLVFDRDYYWDGQGDYVRAKTGSMSMTEGYSLGYSGCRFDQVRKTDTADNYFKYLYGLVNRANYLIYNAEELRKSLKSESGTLEQIVAEGRFLRGLAYFRLISMWGDVPYFQEIIDDNEIAAKIPRTPIEIVKDSILADMSYAIEKLPEKKVADGKAWKVTALAFRGKVQLFWASWNNFGWDELSDLGTFVPDKKKAVAAYACAAADFKEIIENEQKYGVSLFRDGEPGECDEPGSIDKMPNYYYMFLPSTGNGSPENLFVLCHGAAGSEQCEELMRDFGTKTTESSDMQLQPRLRIVNVYQSTITGDYCDQLVYKSDVPAGSDPYKYKNCYLNPASYKDRDYRMKSSIVWEYEPVVGLNNLKETGLHIYSYKNLTGEDVGGTGLPAVNADDDYSGVIMRKFVRNYSGLGRSEGNYNFPLMRLADVYLMYAEAINEVNDGPDQLAVELVNKVRHRGNLPPLGKAKIATKDNFFNAVIQERTVELFAEGHRAFDIRRWRMVGTIAGAPLGNGLSYFDTWGDRTARMLHQADNITYKRTYIFRIPTKEIARNSNLIQNPCWL